jgi:hypothetical protein
MKKKFSTDFMFKDSIIWVDSLTKSLHWYVSSQLCLVFSFTLNNIGRNLQQNVKTLSFLNTYSLIEFMQWIKRVP